MKRTFRVEWTHDEQQQNDPPEAFTTAYSAFVVNSIHNLLAGTAPDSPRVTHIEVFIDRKDGS